MNSARSQQLRADVLTKLRLPTDDHTEKLVEALRKFLGSRATREELRKSKPDRRQRLAQEFLHSQTTSGFTQKRHFWSTSGNTVSDSQIVKDLADFMFLDVGKIPRHIPEDSELAMAATTNTAESSQSTQQDSLQVELEAGTKAAEAQMERLEKQDPTYTEGASDFVEDTYRETRKGRHLSMTSDPKQKTLNQPPSSANAPGLTPYERMVVKARKSKDTQMNPPSPGEPAQVRTPPPTDKRAGKRRAITPDDLPIPGKAYIEPVPPDPLVHGEPAAKKARLSKSDHGTTSHAPPTGLINPQHAKKVSWTPEGAPSSSMPVAGPGERPSTPRLSSPLQQNLGSSRISPPRVDFHALGPPSPPAATILGPELPTSVSGNSSRDRIEIDFEDVEPSGLFELPSIFIDQIAARKQAHEERGTNASRVRAAVLGAIEGDLRRRWKGV